MRKLGMIGILSLMLSAGFASANESSVPTPPQDGECHGSDCRPPLREACFNLVCFYEKETYDEFDVGSPGRDEDIISCRAAATFNAFVTKDGGEWPETLNHDSVQLEVQCGDKLFYNGGARRFANLLGSRIEGEQGPFPAINLPRGALHTGVDGLSGNHVSYSTLDFEGREIKKMRGKCFIYTTGTPGHEPHPRPSPSPTTLE